jgi:phage gp29-like protein
MIAPGATPLFDAVTDSVRQRTDPSLGTGAAPNFGRKAVPHILSFSGLASSVARVYRNADEAIRDSLSNARFMRNDIGIMECLEGRQRCVAELAWHIEPEDDKSTEQKELCGEVTKLLTRIRRFSELRRCLMESIWYGRAGIQLAWQRERMDDDRSCVVPQPAPGDESLGWWPIHGDKLAFRYDDGKKIYGPHGEELGNIGLRISSARANHPELRPYIHQTDRHMAYFFPRWQREMLMIHRHQIEDGAYEDPLSAGSINGVGIRSRVYWEWFQKQELLAMLMEYLERSSAGIEIWEYPAGNPQAKADVEAMATERRGPNRSVILFPKPMGEDASLFDVRHVEPGMAGAQVLQDLLTEYYGKRIKRYILGQTLSSEADATGMGSGVADAHIKTQSQITGYDARNLEETITYELLKPLVKFNFPHATNIRLAFKIETEDPEVEQRMMGYREAWDMGARIKEADVLETIGSSAPQGDDVVLQNSSAGQDPMEQPGDSGWQADPNQLQNDEPHDTEELTEHVGEALQEHAATPGDGASLMESAERYSKAHDASKRTERHPSDPQKTAGNYKKGKFWLRGLEFSIESPKGAKRSGHDRDGNEWSITMPCHYGYLRRTIGEDGEQVDVFIGGREQSELAFVVDQMGRDGQFDEHKVMVGFDNESEALAAYGAAYSANWKGFEAITPVTWPQLRSWLESGDMRKPAAESLAA